MEEVKSDRYFMRFVKTDKTWVSIVPEWVNAGGKMSDLYVVNGLYLLLQELAISNNVNFFITTNPLTSCIKLRKIRTYNDICAYRLSTINEPELQTLNFTNDIWLQPPFAFIFRGYPETLYLRKI